MVAHELSQGTGCLLGRTLLFGEPRPSGASVLPAGDQHSRRAMSGMAPAGVRVQVFLWISPVLCPCCSSASVSYSELLSSVLGGNLSPRKKAIFDRESSPSLEAGQIAPLASAAGAEGVIVISL